MASANTAATSALFARKRAALAETILPRMGRIMGNVIADEARQRCTSVEVRATIKVRVGVPTDGKINVRIVTSGRGDFMAPWLEFGTDPHVIGLRNLPEGQKRKALKINGRYVHAPVLHPGARPEPFMRPAIDLKMEEAIRMGQQYAGRALKRANLDGPDE